MSVLTHFRLSERDNRGNSVVFSIAPESIDDNRENTFDTGNASDGSSTSELTPSTLKSLGTRKISFTVTVDSQMSEVRPLKVASTLRSWLQPVGPSGSKNKSLHGQPPILILTGYDIMECYLSKCDFTVKQYDVDKTDKLVTFEAKLEVVQYIDPKNPGSAWNGLGGSFGSSADLNKALSERRMRNASKLVKEAYASISAPYGSMPSVNWSDPQFQAVRDLVESGALRQDELEQMIQAHIDEEIRNLDAPGTIDGFNVGFTSNFEVIPRSTLGPRRGSGSADKSYLKGYGHAPGTTPHQRLVNSIQANMGLFL